MTSATSAPVRVPMIAIPKRLKNQPTTQPTGLVTYDESPWPRIVWTPQLSDAPSEPNVSGFSTSVMIDRRDQDEDERPEQELAEEPPVDGAADAGEMPADTPEDRAAEQGREESLHDRGSSCHTACGVRVARIAQSRSVAVSSSSTSGSSPIVRSSSSARPPGGSRIARSTS